MSISLLSSGDSDLFFCVPLFRTIIIIIIRRRKKKKLPHQELNPGLYQLYYKGIGWLVEGWFSFSFVFDSSLFKIRRIKTFFATKYQAEFKGMRSKEITTAECLHGLFDPYFNLLIKCTSKVIEKSS